MAGSFIDQAASEVVDVTAWEVQERYTFLTGAREKSVVICPDPAPFPFLMPGHNYVFKRPEGRFATQVWSEALAYRFGTLVGIDVPPTFIGIDTQRGRTGALIEFFYGHPGRPRRQFFHASDRLTPTIVNADLGRPHTLDLNLDLCRELRLPQPRVWWARTLAFDALIGNGDRHPSNWGYFEEFRGAFARRSFAPAFDNGSSLAYEVLDDKLGSFDDKRLHAYVQRGTHHLTLEPVIVRQGEKHFDLCTALVRDAPPLIRTAMARIGDLSDDVIAASLRWATGFDVGVVFTAKRADFLCRLLRVRRDTLRRAIGI